jgi:hypothetical protein
MKRYYLISLIVFGFVLSLFAQETVLVKIDDIYPRDLVVEGFRLPQKTKIEINATGLHQESGKRKYILGTCWILSTENRQVIWQFPPNSYHGGRSKPETRKEEIELPAGSYEVYYSSYPYLNVRYDWDDRYRHKEHGFFGNLFEWLFGDHRGWDNYRFDRADLRDFQIIVKGNGQSLTREQVFDNLEKIQEKAFINLQGTWDDEYLYQGFQVNKPVSLHIYAIGELRDDGQYDFGWIINTESRDRVWEMKYENTAAAGGSRKNRQIDEKINLEPGKYAVYYVTDDSHSPRAWNTAPPQDPYFWGITLTVDGDLDAIAEMDYDPLNKQREIVSIIRMRDDQYESAGFTLKKPMPVQIYAIGEGRRKEMFDYGWIIDATTREKVWQMNYRNTTQAGGAEKNRLFDGLVELPAGSYIVSFVTDGSHSFRHWNASPPMNPEYWGITVLIPSGEETENIVTGYEEAEDPNRLVGITRVRNHEYIQEGFVLDEDTDVRIYALGEGIRGEMYDYAWIEDVETGRVVWEMTYRMTDHAGGARKNRYYNDVISLKKGNYRVVYESDDSHSFNSWNDSPPFDPANWGIIVTKAI